MAKSNFDRSLTAVLKHEGGYVDHPRDPGGATNFGITHRTLAAWRKAPVTKQDVMRLTKSEAGAIYEAQYWEPIKGDDLPAGLDYALFDFTVNSGAGRAVRTLQRVLGVEADGQMGIRTMQAIKSADVRQTINKLQDARLAFLRRLSTFDVFGRGWTRRVEDVRRLALSMASGRPVVAPDVPVVDQASAKARAQDTAIRKTPEGKGAIATGVGTVGQIITEQAKSLEPVAGYAPALQWLFAALMVAGVAFTLWHLIRRAKSGELS